MHRPNHRNALINGTASSRPQANASAQQSIAQVRTVAAYNGEKKALDSYSQLLELPLKVRGGALVPQQLCALCVSDTHFPVPRWQHA